MEEEIYSSRRVLSSASVLLSWNTFDSFDGFLKKSLGNERVTAE